MIRYLETEEKWKMPDLWREAFPEDSTEFCDYYFKEKMKDNRVLVREENGEIVSMVHRNPYRIYMREMRRSVITLSVSQRWFLSATRDI